MSATYRVVHDTKYTVISNKTIQDERLSCKATGLLCLLLSYPDGWEVNLDHLSTKKLDGKDSLKSALTELKQFGYIVRRRVFGSDGRINWESEIHETPPEGDPTIDGFATGGKSAHGQSADGRRVSSMGGKATSGRVSTGGKTTSGKTTDGKTTSGKTSEWKSHRLISNKESSTDLPSNEKESTDLPSNEEEQITLPIEIGVMTASPMEEIASGGSKSKGKGKGKDKSDKVAKPKPQLPLELERFKNLYNDRRPQLWAAMQLVSPDRQKTWKALVETVGGVEEALTALGNALDFCAADSWYSSKTLNFENFATNGKILQLHERQISKVEMAGSGAPGMTASDARMMHTYNQLMEAGRNAGYA